MIYSIRVMQINFYPSWDKPEYEEAAKEYAKIWEEEGRRITEAIEKVSRLKFREKVINAVTFGGISYSTPLRLQSNLSKEDKKGTIVHELCHRLLVGNNIKLKGKITEKNFDLEAHRLVYLILYEIWTELYDEEFAKKQVELEKSISNDSKNAHWAAWDWALSMTKEERQKEFRKYLKM